MIYQFFDMGSTGNAYVRKVKVKGWSACSNAHALCRGNVSCTCAVSMLGLHRLGGHSYSRSLTTKPHPLRSRQDLPLVGFGGYEMDEIGITDNYKDRTKKKTQSQEMFSNLKHWVFYFFFIFALLTIKSLSQFIISGCDFRFLKVEIVSKVKHIGLFTKFTVLLIF